jgi:peptidoglycan hydrolase-like protein with peptidoglycan-binding domain
MEIKLGDKGDEVADVQRRLAALGYDLGAPQADGRFGLRTQEAVKRFQADRRLSLTGTVDESTWRRMVDDTYQLGARALYLRSPFFHGGDVRQLQLWLNAIGFRAEPVDGIFGPSTEKAVREFQDNSGLIADGIVGHSTLAALNNIRTILDKHYEPIIYEPPMAESVVSLLQDRQVAVGCLTPHKHDWLSPVGNRQLLCADLSHRLSNLLEILGVHAHFFKLKPEPEIVGDLAVVFHPGAGKVGADSLGVCFDHQDQESKVLAGFVIAELKRSLKEEIREVVVGDCRSWGRPAVEVLPGDFVSLSAEEDLRKEVLRQKIAGAIFDGLKKFIVALEPDPP